MRHPLQKNHIFPRILEKGSGVLDPDRNPKPKPETLNPKTIIKALGPDPILWVLAGPWYSSKGSVKGCGT